MSRGVVVTMVSVISAAICDAGILGMLGEIAVGLAGLVQFGDAGTALVVEYVDNTQKGLQMETTPIGHY